MIPNKFRIPHKRTAFLDGGFLYDYYFRVMGLAHSKEKLTRVCKEVGMVNLFGEPPTPMGCWKAMWRWACKEENHQKAYELYNGHLANKGLYITFDEFKDLLRDKVYSALQFKKPKDLERFLKRNGLA